MVTLGILAILILFGVGILFLPQKPPENKKYTLIEVEGPIETVEIKKVEELLIR